MQILMGSGKVDVNAAVEGTNETILHILARKSDKSNFSYNVYIECLKYALRSPGVNVDAIENTASMTPLFIATEESKSKEAAIALIKAGKLQKIIFVLYNFFPLIFPRHIFELKDNNIKRKKSKYSIPPVKRKKILKKKFPLNGLNQILLNLVVFLLIFSSHVFELNRH